VEWAQGNPFYLEELLAFLFDQGADLGDPAVGTQIKLPVSLQSLILSRVDQLAERVQLTLKAASVLGRLVRVGWLAGYQPALGTVDQLQADLVELAQIELAVLDTPAPELAYLFKHIVTHEAVYGGLAEEVRARLHEQVATWLEQAGSADLDLLAHHYSRSANTAKRRTYLRQAGEAAARVYADAAAIDYYERLLAELPQADRERALVLQALGDVLERQSAWESAAARYTEALAIADSAAERAAAARGLGVVCYKQGAFEAGQSWLETAQAAYAAAGDQRGIGQTLSELGQAYWMQGAYERARELLLESQQAAETVGDWATIARARYRLGILALRQGDFGAAQTLLEESLSLYRDKGDRAGIASVLNSMGIVALEQNQASAAWALLEESLALRRELGLRWGIALTLGNLGLAAHSRGDWETARALHEESLALSQELGDQLTTANTLQNLGLGALDQGEYQQAQRYLADCLSLCQRLGPGAPTPAALAGAAVLAPGEGAARLLGAVDQLLAEQGVVLEALEQRVYTHAQTAAQAALGEAAYKAVLNLGQALTWEQAIAEALALLASSD
jgi:adenylate cyclase